jgi:hypothetical protein
VTCDFHSLFRIWDIFSLQQPDKQEQRGSAAAQRNAFACATFAFTHVFVSPRHAVSLHNPHGHTTTRLSWWRAFELARSAHDK